MRHLELYIFDLDGTLLDSGKDIALAANYAFEKLNLKTFSEEEIISKVGYGAKKLIEDLIPEYPQEIKDKALEYFKEFYYSNPVIYSKLYDGAEETLKKLKELSKKVAVVTNKYEALSTEILKKLNVIDYIDLVVGADTTSEKKPHPLPVFYTLEKLKSDKDKSIIIGDSETDVLTGKNAGIKTALVLQGYGNKDLALSLNPDYVLDSLKFI
ncbi:HAD family hydrolase [Sulfurihydrogenibium yellowstonense]|uniref:phosphoglycolate phosphatase n=1 Tax=Sulfurihydrogenibium yellowstonense SS-5 TaxID=432331 RepID=C4FIU6_9AQUI|nr:HAD-IA family hydrolase [Sulfurihydrogenibium yellowstonense]EEP60994.1 phosphoglycolate phosphatase [Sulfurihydrogenibium yellowstonense SS-5]